MMHCFGIKFKKQRANDGFIHRSLLKLLKNTLPLLELKRITHIKKAPLSEPLKQMSIYFFNLKQYLNVRKDNARLYQTV